MTAVSNDLDRVGAIVAELDPRAMGAEVDERTGARLRSKDWSSAGSRSANTTVPRMTDPEDRRVQREWKEYRREIRDALRSLSSALARQTGLLASLHDGSERGGRSGHPTPEALELAAEDVSAKATGCSNCARVVERTANDKLLSGRCRRCYDYWKKHSVERPSELWEREMAA